VSPRRFSGVSDLGALYFSRVVSSNRRPEKTLKVPPCSPARGGAVLRGRQPDGDTRAHGGRIYLGGGSYRVLLRARRFLSRSLAVPQPFLRALHAGAPVQWSKTRWSIIDISSKGPPPQLLSLYRPPMAFVPEGVYFQAWGSHPETVNG
jgi:hypothetical protein